MPASDPSSSVCWSASEGTLEHKEMERPSAVIEERPPVAPVKEAGREDRPLERNGGAAAPEPPPARPARRPTRWVILAIATPLLIFAAIYGMRWLQFTRTHVSTD